jgi:hypothetical protein
MQIEFDEVNASEQDLKAAIGKLVMEYVFGEHLPPKGAVPNADAAANAKDALMFVGGDLRTLHDATDGLDAFFACAAAWCAK